MYDPSLLLGYEAARSGGNGGASGDLESGDAGVADSGGTMSSSGDAGSGALNGESGVGGETNAGGQVNMGGQSGVGGQTNMGGQSDVGGTSGAMPIAGAAGIGGIAAGAGVGGAVSTGHVCKVTIDLNGYTPTKTGCGSYSTCKGQIHWRNNETHDVSALTLSFSEPAGVKCTATNAGKFMLADDGATSHRCVINVTGTTLAANGTLGFGYDTTQLDASAATAITVTDPSCSD